jgi:hypothetical protein
MDQISHCYVMKNTKIGFLVVQGLKWCNADSSVVTCVVLGLRTLPTCDSKALGDPVQRNGGAAPKTD